MSEFSKHLFVVSLCPVDEKLKCMQLSKSPKRNDEPRNTCRAREDKGDRQGIPYTHPIPQVIRLELFLRPQIPRGIRQQPVT